MQGKHEQVDAVMADGTLEQAHSGPTAEMATETTAPRRMMPTVRKPKPTAGWSEETGSGILPMPTTLAAACAPLLSAPLPSTEHAADSAGQNRHRQMKKKKGQAQDRNSQTQPTHAQSATQAKARPCAAPTKGAPSTAERATNLHGAYQARMQAMRSSRAGGARRQARSTATEVPEPAAAEAEQQGVANAPAPPAPADMAALLQGGAGGEPLLRLSRAQRRQLARGLKSTAVVDAALDKMHIVNPTMRAAVTEAVMSGTMASPH